LSNKTGEIVVFEIGRKQRDGELSGVGDDETVTGVAPTDNGVRAPVFHHIVTFFQERRNRSGTVFVRFHHREYNKEEEKRRVRKGN